MDFETTASFTLDIEVRDAAGATDITSVVVTLIDANEAPTVVGPGDVIISEDTSTGPLTFTVADSEATPLVVTATTSDNTLLPVVVVSGVNGTRTVSITPAADLNGSATITLTVSDGVNETTSDFAVTVTPVNDQPVAAMVTPINTFEDAVPEIVDLTALFTDVDILTNADSLAYDITNPGVGGIVVPTITGGQLELALLPNANGSDFITVIATDQSGATTELSIPITVAAVNDTPTTQSPAMTRSALEDAPMQTMDLSAVFNDVDILSNADALQFRVVSNNAPSLWNADVVGDELQVTFMPDANGIGVVVVEAEDSVGEVVQMVLTMNITPVNDAPDGQSESFRIGGPWTTIGRYRHTAPERERPRLIEPRGGASQFNHERRTYIERRRIVLVPS